ncbi:MAG: sugar phosphate isomerase/epimerase [Victivallales bacterium]|nr:sugar phosphate isomerase/epimerase [Victivallales bacterium]
MLYGLAAWGLRQTPLQAQIDMAARLGLPILELGIAGCPNDLLQADSTRRDAEAASALFAPASVRPLCVATGNDFTAGSEAEVLASLRRTLAVIRLASQVGARYLRVFAGFAPKEEVTGRRFDLLVDCLRRIYEAGDACGVLPVVETHGGVKSMPDGTVRHFASVSTEDDTLDRLLSEIPALRLNFDPANLFVLGRDVCRFYQCYRERVAYAHLKDFAPKGAGYVPVACGEGGITWRDLLGALRHFEGPALLEYEMPADVERGFAASLAFLRGMEDECAS